MYQNQFPPIYLSYLLETFPLHDKKKKKRKIIDSVETTSMSFPNPCVPPPAPVSFLKEATVKGKAQLDSKAIKIVFNQDFSNRGKEISIKTPG